ncbi:MAG TPA: hypothetical protein VI643_03900 [Planctomycetota bacterium]|nr:hypothetical protein [Planctomycetota bacterium]
MGTGSASGIIRAPGRLCYGATDLTADFPHGGTALGFAREVVFEPRVQVARSKAEEWGGTTSRVYYTGEEPRLACVFREVLDADMLSAMFPNIVSGSFGTSYIEYSPAAAGQNDPGYDLNAKAVKLVFSPYSPDYHPFVILYHAFPAIDETTKLNLGLNAEIGVGAVWWAGVDSAGRCYKVGRRQELVSKL